MSWEYVKDPTGDVLTAGLSGEDSIYTRSAPLLPVVLKRLVGVGGDHAVEADIFEIAEGSRDDVVESLAGCR